jgi:hypothetical protein
MTQLAFIQIFASLLKDLSSCFVCLVLSIKIVFFSHVEKYNLNSKSLRLTLSNTVHLGVLTLIRLSNSNISQFSFLFLLASYCICVINVICFNLKFDEAFYNLNYFQGKKKRHLKHGEKQFPKERFARVIENSKTIKF